MSVDLTTYNRLVEILREREFELFTIRHTFDELSDKFSQLENAFAINLRVHRALERELETHRLGKSPNETERNYFDKRENADFGIPMEVHASLTRIRMEKERWREAFLHEKKISEKLKREQEEKIDKIRDECEAVMTRYRETSEKRLRELSKIREGSLEKIRVSKEVLKASKARERLSEDRILELANLLETLTRVKGVKIDALCIHTAEVLRSLAKYDENPYEEGMKKLRHVTWDVKEDEGRSLEFLQAQNSVLRQIVKSLKRKDNLRASPRNDECTGQIESNNNPDGRSATERIEEENHEKSMESQVEKVISKGSAFWKNSKERVRTIGENCPADETNIKSIRNAIACEITHPLARRSISVEAFESHRNGIRFEEYTLNFLNNREIRVRHPKDREIKNSTLNVEFVDTEKKFQQAPIDRTVFYLGTNVKEIANFDRLVTHCGAQTRRVKFFEKFVQTTITGGSNGFVRINAGVGIMNSEKRAIERSVGNLENTVAGLKENALGEALSMIGCDVKYLGDEFFNCVRRLES